MKGRKEDSMKIAKISDIEKFFSAVDTCSGLVWLVTAEGDRLNLKSKLSQYVSLANIFSEDNKNAVPELEIMFSDPEDAEKLKDFTK